MQVVAGSIKFKPRTQALCKIQGVSEKTVNTFKLAIIYCKNTRSNTHGKFRITSTRVK